MRRLLPFPLLLFLPFTARAQPPDFTAAGHVRGSASARIEIVELGDFACAFCGHFARETLPPILRAWVDTGRARFRFVPFDMSVFRPGRLAARAAECAAEQQRFWEMHDLLFERQREWLGRGSQRDRMMDYARDLGLDLTRFATCWEQDPGASRIAAQTEMARALHVRATPTFLIGDVRAEGALPVSDLTALLEAAERAARDGPR